MPGVFLSYSRVDAAIGRQVIAGLRALGVDCWWDEDLPGVPWQEELERQINALTALVVIWSQASRNSKFVRAEAALAMSSDKLVNVLVGIEQPPFPFNGINGLPLDGWTGREPHNGWTRLVKTIENQLVQAGAAAPGSLTAALSKHEQAVRAGHRSLAAAEAAFADAKAAEGASDQALQEARAALASAEQQLGRVGEMHAGPNVLRGAQADFDDARGALKDAEASHRASAGQLSTASRALAQARTALDDLFGAETPLGESSLSAAAPDQPPPAVRQTVSEPPPSPALGAPAAKPAARWRLFAAAGGLAVVTIAGLALVLAHAGRPVPSAPASAAAAATPAPDPAVVAARSLVGDWSGNGAVCGSNPLSVSLDETARTVHETVSNTPSAGTVVGERADGAVELRFAADGHTESDSVSGDTLTLAFASGSMTYARCKP
jgi:hypothetical protein